MARANLFLLREQSAQKMREYDELLLNTLREMAEETSQTAVAKKIGISLPYLNDFIHGRRTVTDRLWDLAAAAEIHVPVGK